LGNRDGCSADTGGMNELEHDRLDVFQAAIQFLALADTMAGGLPRGRSCLADQLARSQPIKTSVAEH